MEQLIPVRSLFQDPAAYDGKTRLIDNVLI